MKIVKVHVERTFNLGDYNSRKAGLEAELTETERPLDVMLELEMLLHQHNENMLKTKFTAPDLPKPTPQPTAQPKPAQIKNPADYDLCPRCGKSKQKKYPLCYVCNEEDKAE